MPVLAAPARMAPAAVYPPGRAADSQLALAVGCPLDPAEACLQAPVAVCPTVQAAGFPPDPAAVFQPAREVECPMVRAADAHSDRAHEPIDGIVQTLPADAADGAPMEFAKNWSGLIGSLLASVVVVAGAFFYMGSLESRVTQLEKQVHVLAVAPSLVQAESASTNPNEAVANPVASACADLARKAAEHAAKAEFTAELDVRAILKDLGCTLP